MHVGIDFGTSSCLASQCVEGRTSPFMLSDEGHAMPSAMYVLKTMVEGLPMDDPSVQRRLKSRVSAFKAEQTKELKQARQEGRRSTQRIFSDLEIERLVKLALQREIQQQALEKTRLMPLLEALNSDSEVVFGDLAIETSLLEGDDGFFLKSPKSFLGANLGKYQLDSFQAVCARMLGHIKARCEKQSGKELTQAVIGRPVNFHGTQGETGNKQAISLLTSAASEAGFSNVSFLLEPVAAAIDFERTLNRDVVVLVVDIGGGTTDCTMLPLGPSFQHASEADRQASVLAYAGDRTGGLDLDIMLSHHEFMPAFGKGSLTRSRMPIPAHFFWDGCAVNDIELQRRFINEDLAYYVSQAAEPKKLGRLLALQELRAMPQLQMTAEATKISLSEQSKVFANLNYLGPRFSIAVSRANYEAAIERPLERFIGLAKETVKQAERAPDIVYVTGGTAQAPVIRSALRDALGDVELVSGNLFQGVVSGLGVWASQLYR